MRWLLIKFFEFEIMQKKWGRKWIGGTFYYVDMSALSMSTFWIDSIPGYSQAKILEVQSFPLTKKNK